MVCSLRMEGPMGQAAGTAIRRCHCSTCSHTRQAPRHSKAFSLQSSAWRCRTATRLGQVKPQTVKQRQDPHFITEIGINWEYFNTSAAPHYPVISFSLQDKGYEVHFNTVIVTTWQCCVTFYSGKTNNVAELGQSPTPTQRTMFSTPSSPGGAQQAGQGPNISTCLISMCLNTLNGRQIVYGVTEEHITSSYSSIILQQHFNPSASFQ